MTSPAAISSTSGPSGARAQAAKWKTSSSRAADRPLNDRRCTTVAVGDGDVGRMVGAGIDRQRRRCRGPGDLAALVPMTVIGACAETDLRGTIEAVLQSNS
jgi:hypothetical protein